MKMAALIVFLFLLAFFATYLLAKEPPFAVKDPAQSGDNVEIFHEMATHQHDGNGSYRIPRRDIAPRTNATPHMSGELIYDSTGLVMCYSTGTLNSQWALITSSTTPCPH